MTLQPRSRTTHAFAFAVALVVVTALTFVFVADAPLISSEDGGPEMRMSISEPAGVCEGSVCQLGESDEFTLSVEAVTAPDGGYIGMTTFVWFGPHLTYKQAGAALDEVLWPDCASAAAVLQLFGEEAVSHGCLTGLVPPLPLSEHVGLLTEMTFTCAPNSQSTVRLLPLDDDTKLGQLPDGRDIIAGSSGAAFAQPPVDNPVSIVPKVNDLVVICGDPPTPTPPPTNTPGGHTETPTPSATPTPDVTATPPEASPTPTPEEGPPPTFIRPATPCGDVNLDFHVDSQDALWVLWFFADMVPFLPHGHRADVNSDGLVNPLDALHILWIQLNFFFCR